MKFRWKLSSWEWIQPLVILIGLWFWLFAANWVPGTRLSGWDTLHPEFDLGRYAERAWNGAWQEHQGVGAAASQSHIGELTRLPMIWFLMQVVPDDMVRYVFFALMGLAGMVGMYVYVGQTVLVRQEVRWRWWIAMLAGFFYLFNVGTMQHFLVPLEMFAVHFASLPWLWWMLHRYLSSGRTKDLWWLGIIGFLSSSMSHTATLFYMQILMMGLYGLAVALMVRRKAVWGRSLLAVLVMIVVNLFWMGPNLYYVFSHGDEVAVSKIHHLFSHSAFLRSREYGTLDNLVRLKNFLFSWQLYDFATNQFVPIMQQWESHLNRIEVRGWSYVSWLIALAGFGVLSRKRRSVGIGLGAMMLTAIFFWINQNPPFTLLYSWLRQLLPLFVGEALRFPFTKFSVFLLFGLASLMAVGHGWLLRRGNLIWRLSYLLLVIVMTLWQMKPAFEGAFVSPAMQVAIPDRYMAMFDWFEQHDAQKRILKLPFRSYWGWEYYDWGYQGAGFTWFGLQQPTFDREFDRWNLLNETAYLQMKSALDQALLANDPSNFSRLLSLWRRYNIGYLLVDESVMTPMETDSRRQAADLKGLLATMGIPPAWEQGGLAVYQVPSSESENLSGVAEVRLATDYLVDDVAMREWGNYLSDPTNQSVRPAIHYPMANFDPRIVDRPQIGFEEGLMTIERQISLTGDYELRIPAFSAEAVWPIAIWASNTESGISVRLAGYRPGLLVNGGVVFEPHMQEQGYRFAASRGADYLFVNEVSYPLATLNATETLLGYIPATQSGTMTLATARKTDQQADDVFTELIEEEIFTFDFGEPPTTNLPIHGAITLSIVLPDFGGNQVDRFARTSAYNCDVFGRGQVAEVFDGERRIFRASGEGSTCNYVDYDFLKGFTTFLVRLTGENRSGEGLRVYLRDNDILENNLEELLLGEFRYAGVAYAPGDQGQILSLHTKSYGNIDTVNALRDAQVSPFPATWLSQIRLEPIAGHVWPKERILRNGQGYDQGWIAILNGELLPHVQVNGWENGWILPPGFSEKEVLVVFWPSYLEWMGWGALGVCLLLLGRKAFKS